VNTEVAATEKMRVSGNRVWTRVPAVMGPAQGGGRGRVWDGGRGSAGFASTRRFPNVWGFERLGDTVLGYQKHLICTVLGPAVFRLRWCSNLGASQGFQITMLDH
jgi:hypothetical protein